MYNSWFSHVFSGTMNLWWQQWGTALPIYSSRGQHSAFQVQSFPAFTQCMCVCITKRCGHNELCITYLNISFYMEFILVYFFKIMKHTRDNLLFSINLPSSALNNSIYEDYRAVPWYTDHLPVFCLDCFHVIHWYINSLLT